jgi:uncharacterized protein
MAWGGGEPKPMPDSSALGLPPRFVPDEPFPPYSYVTGKFPHPTRDPSGHHFQRPAEPATCPTKTDWNASRPYLHGVDLFNYGYYWEAHETWESLWHACGRAGATADFLKGLIKLAAAGVKAREGRPPGVARHARRAQELFQSVSTALAPEHQHLGLDLAELTEMAGTLAENTTLAEPQPLLPVQPIFPYALRLGRQPSVAVFNNAR